MQVPDTYKEYYDMLKAHLDAKFGGQFSDLPDDDPSLLLIEWIAYSMQAISWTTDKKISDVIVELTSSLRVAGYIARSNGMKPQGRSPIVLLLTLKNTGSGEIFIPKYSLITASNGSDYYFLADITIGGSATEQVEVYSGSLIQTSYQATNTINQKIDVSSFMDIAEHSIVEGSIDIDGWKEQEFLSFELTNQFVVDYINSIIEFGDCITGKIPSNVIDLTFLISKGPEDSIDGLSEIEFDTVTPYERNDLTYDDLFIDGIRVMSAGTKGDLDIDRLKKMFPVYQIARYSCIKAEDFEVFGERFTHNGMRISQAKAYLFTEPETDVEIVSAKSEFWDAFQDILETYATYTDNFQARMGEFESILESISLYLEGFHQLMDNIASRVSSINTLSSQISKNVSAEIELVKSSAQVVDNNGDVITINTPLDEESRSVGGVTHGYSPNTNDFFFDLMSETANISSFSGIISGFKDQNGQTISDYISQLLALTADIKTIEDTILKQQIALFEQQFASVFEQMSSNISRVLKAAGTTAIMKLSCIVRDSSGTIIPIAQEFTQKIQEYFRSIKDPMMQLEVIDGSVSVVTGAKIKVQVRKVGRGATSMVVISRIRNLLSRTFSNAVIGFGTSIYRDEVETLVHSVYGVEGVDILIEKPEGDSRVYSDDFGNLIIPEAFIFQDISFTVS